MAIPSIYINLDDDVSKIAIRLRRQSAKQAVLVCPKRCLLFSDSINLRLLKKQADLLGKEIFVLTMDERGQIYAKEAGFGLKFLPKVSANRTFSDVRPPAASRLAGPADEPAPEEPAPEDFAPRAIQPQPADKPAVKVAAPNFWSATKPEAAAESAARAAEETARGEEQPVLPPPAEDGESPDMEKTGLQDAAPAAIEPAVRETENFFPAEIQQEYDPARRHSRLPKVILGVLALAILVALSLVFVVLPKAVVVITPKSETVSRSMQISLNAAAASPEPAKLVLPVTKVEQAVNVSDKFQSQGQNQVGNKAGGTVKIYNFTGVPINLRAATTLLTVGNKTYRLVNDALDVPPTRYSNAAAKEVDLKSLGPSIQVQASQGGDDYNLPAGTRMEISNQVFGSRPQLLYAKSDTEIAGGTTRYLSYIAADDITGAQTQLQKDALSQVRQQLRNFGEVLPDGAYSITVSQFTTDSPAGTQTPSFQGSLTAQVTGLAFKQDDLDNLVNQRIGQTLAANKTLQAPTPQDATYTVQNLDLVNEAADMQLQFNGTAVYNVDVSGLASQLKGKSLAQVNSILTSNPNVQQVQVTLAPVWQKNMPWLASKITVQLGGVNPN